MKHTLAFLAALFLLSSCVGVNPNEGVFVINNQVKPRLSKERLAEVRRTWTPSSQPKSEASKVGRDYAWWILDLIAHNESPPERPCAKLELLEIRPKALTLLVPRGDGYGFVRAESYHEAWIVNVCGTMREWRVLDDSANPHNPLRVFPWNASQFIVLGRTSKNKRILAVKAQGLAAEALAARRRESLVQIAEIKRFYELRERRLEQLLAA